MIIKNLIKETNLPEISRAANEAPKKKRKPVFPINKCKQNGAGLFHSVVECFYRMWINLCIDAIIF